MGFGGRKTVPEVVMVHTVCSLTCNIPSVIGTLFLRIRFLRGAFRNSFLHDLFAAMRPGLPIVL